MLDREPPKAGGAIGFSDGGPPSRSLDDVAP
jgi:hypothetical protein